MKYCLWSRYVTLYRKIGLLNLWTSYVIPELIRSFIFIFIHLHIQTHTQITIMKDGHYRTMTRINK